MATPVRSARCGVLLVALCLRAGAASTGGDDDAVHAGGRAATAFVGALDGVCGRSRAQCAAFTARRGAGLEKLYSEEGAGETQRHGLAPCSAGGGTAPWHARMPVPICVSAHARHLPCIRPCSTKSGSAHACARALTQDTLLASHSFLTFQTLNYLGTWARCANRQRSSALWYVWTLTLSCLPSSPKDEVLRCILHCTRRT